MKASFFCDNIFILVAAGSKMVAADKYFQYPVAVKRVPPTKDVQYLESKGYVYIRSFMMGYCVADGSQTITPEKDVQYLPVKIYTHILSCIMRYLGVLAALAIHVTLSKIYLNNDRCASSRLNY